MKDELIEDDGLPAEQYKISRASHLKPWQFQPGQSGNPTGRAKGTISLKEYAKKYLQGLDDEEKLEFMKGIDKDKVWEMAEGKAAQDNNVNLSGDVIISFDNAFTPPPETNSK